MTTETADTEGRNPTFYAYTAPYSQAPAVAQASQEETLASFSANNYRFADGTLRPYELAGPRVSKLRPDVWAVVQAADAGLYDMIFDPGLVIRLGAYGVFNTWYVMFGSKYNQRFLLASSSQMVCKDLAEFCAWLRDHPARGK